MADTDAVAVGYDDVTVETDAVPLATKRYSGCQLVSFCCPCDCPPGWLAARVCRKFPERLHYCKNNVMLST
jgi:hypothetical protein